jgi:hypothetical protein
MIRNTGLPFIVLLIATLAAMGLAKETVFSSVYTDESACKSFDPCEEDPTNCGGDGYTECQGPKDYYLYEWYSAISTMRDVRIRSNDSWNVQLSPTSGLQLQTYGQKTEWRLADGAPFAVIQRTRECDPDVPKRCEEFLVVRGLRGFETIKSDVNAKASNANAEARSIADNGFLSGHKASPNLIVPTKSKDTK